MIPDIVEIKRLCASGQWFAKIENGKILLNDTVAGETVCIGQTDAEPVRHGEWIFRKSFREADECDCSECGQMMTTYSGVRMKYCPNCGARMEIKNEQPSADDRTGA